MQENAFCDIEDSKSKKDIFFIRCVESLNIYEDRLWALIGWLGFFFIQMVLVVISMVNIVNVANAEFHLMAFILFY